jgi:hypothetical protein
MDTKTRRVPESGETLICMDGERGARILHGLFPFETLDEYEQRTSVRSTSSSTDRGTCTSDSPNSPNATAKVCASDAPSKGACATPRTKERVPATRPSPPTRPKNQSAEVPRPTKQPPPANRSTEPAQSSRPTIPAQMILSPKPLSRVRTAKTE